MKPLFLDSDTVTKNLPFDLLFKGIERGFVNFSRKTINQPNRMLIPVKDDDVFLVKPVVSLSDNAIAAKLLTLYPNNEKKYNIPSHQAIVTIFDAETGTLEGVLDGGAITDIRTAVATAVAVKHLSKPQDKRLAIIGTGHQGKSHVEILQQMNQFEEIRVFSRTKEKREKFAKDMNVTACSSIEETVFNADVIVTATLSNTPILFEKYVKKGALVNIVGAPFPNMREVGDDLLHSSQIIADSIEESYKAAGDIIDSKSVIDGELGAVIEGLLDIDWDKTRVFKSNGLAIQDLIAGKIILETYKMNKNRSFDKKK